MRGSKPPLDVRAKAAGIAMVKGVRAASKATGIPIRSLRRYKDDPELAEFGLSAREVVGERLWVAIQVGIDEVFTGLRNPDEPLRSKSEALANLIEKRQLLMGEATARSEVTTFRDYDDHERRALTEFFDRGLLDRGAEEVPATAAGGVPQEPGAEVRQ